MLFGAFCIDRRKSACYVVCDNVVTMILQCRPCTLTTLEKITQIFYPILYGEIGPIQFSLFLFLSLRGVRCRYLMPLPFLRDAKEASRMLAGLVRLRCPPHARRQFSMLAEVEAPAQKRPLQRPPKGAQVYPFWVYSRLRRLLLK